MLKCKIEGCERKVLYKGKLLCRAHYHRFWRFGTYELTKHGKGCISKLGYKIISPYKNGVDIMEHRYIMEQHIGRKLKPFPQETVHHINGNKTDNRIENLILISQSDHVHIHHNRIWKLRKPKQKIFCKICNKPQKAKNLCRFHYHQQYNKKK